MSKTKEIVDKLPQFCYRCNGLELSDSDKLSDWECIAADICNDISTKENNPSKANIFALMFCKLLKSKGEITENDIKNITGVKIK